jgi:hypothetical protein
MSGRPQSIVGKDRASGDDLKALRRRLGLRTQSDLSALIHYLAGSSPARSTLSRQENLPVASSLELVAFLRLLELTANLADPSLSGGGAEMAEIDRLLLTSPGEAAARLSQAGFGPEPAIHHLSE